MRQFPEGKNKKPICIIWYLLNWKCAGNISKKELSGLAVNRESQILCFVWKITKPCIFDECCLNLHLRIIYVYIYFFKAAVLISSSSTDNTVQKLQVENCFLGKVGLIFLAFIHIIIFSFSSNGTIARWDFTHSAAHCNPCHAQWAFPWDGMPFVVAHHLFKHLSEAGGHEVVENWINGWAQVEEDPRDDMDILIDLDNLHVFTVLLVHETPHESIGVEWSPTDAKHDH